jgi:MSHA biogenesis protein MshJ
MKMLDVLSPLFAIIDQRPQRERMMILATTLTCVFIAGMQGMDMLGKKIKTVKSTIDEQSSKVSELSTQLKILQLEYSIDPNSNLKQQQAQLQSDLAKTEKQLEALMYSLVEPKKMVKVIRDLFINQNALQLIQLKNLPSEVLNADAVSNTNLSETLPANTAPELYRHSLVISFEGDFFSVVNYLKALEALKWRFYWKSIDYKVSDYPKAKVTLELHTFSRDKGVLGV